MRAAVKYLPAADGTTLAYAEQGSGLSCVVLSSLPSHLECAWEVDALRSFYDWLGQRARLVRVDYRGSGLSQRGSVPCSMGHIVEDLERVLQYIDAGSVAIFGFGPSTLTALEFAHRFPTRVASLVLHHPFASAADLRESGGMVQLGEIARNNWELFTVLGSTAVFGTVDKRAEQQAALLRAAVTPAEYEAYWSALATVDASAWLADISAPTLIIEPSEGLGAHPNSVRRVAAMLPNCRVVPMEGKFVARVLEDPCLIAAMAEFLGFPAGPTRSFSSQTMAVILFADIVDSTALTERLGDSGFRTRARDLDDRLRALIRAGGGRSIDGKLLGDGVLAVFPSARGAIEVAVACRDASAEASLPLRLGLHAGDVIDEGGNVFGGAVNLAARVAAVADPGEVLVTDTVRSLARTSTDVVFDSRGHRLLKGVGEPQQLFAVLPRR